MLKHLFKPIELSGISLKNRIVMAPMGIGSYNQDESFTEDYIDFIRARSKDTGLIISTGTRISSKYGGLKVNGIYSDRFIPSLKKLAQAAKSQGARFFLQILNFGPADPIDPYAPSIDIPEYMEMDEASRPKELSISQIEEIVEGFGQGALRAKKAGCDGVELFASEDGLLASFMCPHFNKRNDRYGKGLEGRMRLPLEIIDRIRKLCGNDFPIGYKYNALWNIAEGIDKPLSIEIAKILSDAKVAYIHEWSFESWEKPMSMFKVSPMPSLYQPRNTTISLASAIKEAVKVPVIAVGGILKPWEADEMIGQGKTDMVAVGRAFIADGLWANHAAQEKGLRPCIRCHVCHNEVAMLEKIVKCSVNPDVLGKDIMVPAKSPKKVLVAGGGPAGIISAIYASRRGHEVTLYEKEEKLGGKLIAGSRPDFKYEFKDLLAYLEDSVYQSSTKINKGVCVSKELISDLSPESLILCTGAEPNIPKLEIPDDVDVYQAEHALKNAKGFKGQKVIILGGGDVGCETALYLKKLGCEVFIVEILQGLMEEESIEHNSQVLESMLKEASIDIFLGSKLERIENGKAIISKIDTGEKIEKGLDAVIFATGYRSDKKKIDDLASIIKDTHVIGDCKSPGRLVDAIGQGYSTGMKI